MARTELAKFCGSSGSSGFGLPCPTAQKGQRRVHMSPIIMKVAVPLLKHSLMLGQAASSQTVCIFCSRRMSLISKNFFGFGSLARIHSGFFSFSSSGTTLIGMRAVFDAPVCLTPCRLSRGFVSVVIRVVLSFSDGLPSSPSVFLLLRRRTEQGGRIRRFVSFPNRRSRRG